MLDRSLDWLLFPVFGLVTNGGVCPPLIEARLKEVRVASRQRAIGYP